MSSQFQIDTVFFYMSDKRGGCFTKHGDDR